MDYYSLILVGQLNFYLEMLIPVLILLRKQERRSLFILCLLPVAALAVAFAFMPWVGIGPFGFNYLIVAAAVFLIAWFLFNISPPDALFYTIAAFAVQHGLWDILFMIFEAIGELSQAAAICIYIGMYLVAYALFYLFFPVSDVHQGGIKGRGLQFAVSAFIIAFVYVIASFVPWISSWNILYRLYALVCCVFAVGLQCGLFEHTKLKERNRQLEQEKFVLEELLGREQKQYAITKNTIDLINIKCHDLKHQIAELRTMDEAEREKCLKDVERAVMIYGNIAKTGNETLDVVLTEKSFLCEKYGIRFTYMIDGGSISFMEPADISSLFGNALDNAIESVVKESERERRVIKLNASSKRNHLTVHIENYCSEAVQFRDGLPVTSKADKNNHGFGVKSMQYIVKKYGGTCAMRQEDCLVCVDIMLPEPSPEGAPGGDKDICPAEI